MNFDPSTVSAIAAVFSCVSAAAAAITTICAFNYHKKINRNNREFLKLEVTVNYFQEFMLTFAEIRAISDQEWSDQRRGKLRINSEKMRKNLIIIGTLHAEIGNSLDSWHATKDELGNSVSSVVDYVLGNIGAINKYKYDDFFNVKSVELKKIQDDLFNEFNA